MSLVRADGTAVALKRSLCVAERIEALHTGGHVLLSPDASSLVTTCSDTLKLVSLTSGRVESSIPGDTEPITAMAVCTDPQGSFILAAASRSLMLRIHDARTGAVRRAFRAHTAPVLALDFHPSGTLLASAGADAAVKVWDIVQGYCTHNLRGSQGIVGLVKFHPDPTRLHLYSAGDDCMLRVWDLTKSKAIAALNGHVSAVRGIAFMKDGDTVLSVARDKVIHVWNLTKNKLEKTIPAFEALEGIVRVESAGNVKAGKGGEVFVTAGDKGTLRFWSFPDGAMLREIDNPDAVPRTFKSILYSSDIKKLVTVTVDHNLIVTSLESMKEERRITGSYDDIINVKFIEGKDSRIAVATNSEEIRLVSLSDSSSESLHGHTDIVLSLDVSADGRFIVSSGKDNTVRVWARMESSGRFICAGVGQGHAEAVGAVAFSKKTNAFVVSGSKDTTMKMWPLEPLEAADVDAFPVTLASSYTRRAHDKDINALAVAPNDKILASASQDRTVKVWRAADAQVLGTLKGHKRGVWSVQFSPVDQVLASASGDATVKIWSLADYSCLRTFEGHTSSVLNVSFVSQGTQLFTSGSDGLIKLWTIKTNECVETFDQHTDKVWALAVSPSEQFVVSGGSDSVINLWRDDSKEKEDLRAHEEEQKIVLTQELSNHLLHKNYRGALRLAIQLKQPHTLRNVLSAALAEDKKTCLDEIIVDLSNDDVSAILKYVAEWNTNTLHSYVSQSVIAVVLRCLRPDKILALPDIQHTLQSLMPYTERHFQRADRLLQQSSFVDYTWQAARLLPSDTLGLTDSMDTAEDKKTAADTAAPPSTPSKAKESSKAAAPASPFTASALPESMVSSSPSSFSDEEIDSKDAEEAVAPPTKKSKKANGSSAEVGMNGEEAVAEAIVQKKKAADESKAQAVAALAKTPSKKKQAEADAVEEPETPLPRKTPAKKKQMAIAAEETQQQQQAQQTPAKTPAKKKKADEAEQQQPEEPKTPVSTGETPPARRTRASTKKKSMKRGGEEDE